MRHVQQEYKNLLWKAIIAKYLKDGTIKIWSVYEP